MVTKDVATVPTDTAYPMLANDAGFNEIQQIMNDNFGDTGGMSPFDLPAIHVPPAGAQYFTIPDEPPSATIEGVVLSWAPTRTYYEKGMDDLGGEDPGPPQCSSADAKIGNGEYGPGSSRNPTGACATCPMNEWGTARKGGAGKACSEKRIIWLLRAGDAFPTPVTVPPTSLKEWRQYMTRLGMKRLGFYNVVTRIGLEVEKKNGINVAIAKFTRLDTLTPEQALRARQFGVDFQAALATAIAPATRADVPADPDDEVIPAEYADPAPAS